MPKGYISFGESLNILASRLNLYNCEGINWESAGITVGDFYQHQLRGAVIIYGYQTAGGTDSFSYVSKGDELKPVYMDRLKPYLWSKDQSSLLSGSGEPLWTGLCVKEKDLKKYIDEQLRIMKVGFFMPEERESWFVTLKKKFMNKKD